MNSRSRNNNTTSRSGGRRGDTRNSSNSNDRSRPHQPQPQAQQQYVPNLSPKDQADLDGFRVALKELTFNSRPIIEQLTQMARERARSIPGPVSRSILDNLVFNNPKLRSCFLFLIDSICKSVGDPYPASFVKHGLVSAYLRVYGEICAAGDEGQKKDFLRVLPTWNGVFPPEVLREIDSKTSLPPCQSIPTVQSHQPTPALSSSTLKLLQDLKGVFEKPPGPHISGIVSEIFNRLARGGELSRESIGDLDNKAKMSDKSSIISTIKGIISQDQRSTVTSNSVSSSSVNPITIDNMTMPLNFELPPNFQIDLSLLSSIVNLNASNSENSSPTKPIQSQSTDNHFIDIPLTSADLLVSRSNLYKVLYDDLSLHCKTCGVRFRDTKLGHQRMTVHLDSHFRRNMRLKEKSKRVMARDWFGSENDWIAAKSDSDSKLEKTVNIFEDLSALTSSDLVSNSSSLHQLNEKCFVEAIEEEQTCPVKCSVCQETVPLHWNNETEQWIFQGCIRNELNNEIVHKNCQTNESSISKRQKKN